MDIYKCFDQLNRQLIFRLALEAGMPRRILEPYMRYVDSLLIRYQVGCTIGACHSDICSLPQGCPFSMVMVALLMVPWVKQMRSIEVVPRVLADDLMFTASGSGHRARIIRAMQASKTFFVYIGAKVADQKCFTFATDASTRAMLTKHVWDSKGLTIPCKANFRDLGAHLNVARNHNGATLAERLRKATRIAKRLRWMPLDVNVEEKLCYAIFYQRRCMVLKLRTLPRKPSDLCTPLLRMLLVRDRRNAT